MTLSINSKYRPEIDGLRAFAVVGVILNHFNHKILSSGFLGVDIFFVISGYVITRSLINRKSNNFWSFITSFYTRRVKRLIPNLVVFVMIASLFTLVFNPIPDGSLNLGIKALIGVSNISLFRGNSNYFEEPPEFNAFTHTWSLGVEEQFYFLFPLLFWFSGLASGKKNGINNLLNILTLLFVLSLIIFIKFYSSYFPAAYYLMPSRFWEMSSGCLLVLTQEKNLKFINSISRFPSWILFGVMILLMTLPLNMALISTLLMIPTTVLFINSISKESYIYNFLSHRYIVFIGLISYSLYIWHWGVLSISKWALPESSWLPALQVLLILTLSLLSYYLVERPFRKKDWNLDKKVFLSFGLISIGLSISLINLIQKPFRPFFSKINNKVMPIKYKEIKSIQKNMQCHNPKDTSSAISNCLYLINSKDTQNIYLLGDSHSANHYPSIKKAIEGDYTTKVNYLVDRSFGGGIKGVECPKYFVSCIEDGYKKIINLLNSNLKNKDIVILSFSRDTIIKPINQLSNFPRKKDKFLIRNISKNIDMIGKMVKDNGAYLLLVDDIPKPCESNEINEFYRSVIVKGMRNKCIVSQERSLLDRQELTKIYKQIAKNESSIFYIDFHSDLCKDGLCGVYDGSNKLLYADSSPHFHELNPAPLTKQWKSIFSKLKLISN